MLHPSLRRSKRNIYRNLRTLRARDQAQQAPASLHRGRCSSSRANAGPVMSLDVQRRRLNHSAGSRWRTRSQLDTIGKVKHAVHDAAEHHVRRCPRHRRDRPTALRATQRERWHRIHYFGRLLSRRMATSGESPTFSCGSVKPIRCHSTFFGSGAPISTSA